MKEERENQKKKVKKVETEKKIEKEMEKEVEEVQQIEVEDKEEEIEVVDKENRVEGRMEGREGEVIEGWRRKKGFRCIYVNNLLIIIFLIVKGVNKQKKWNKAEKG